MLSRSHVCALGFAIALGACGDRARTPADVGAEMPTREQVATRANDMIRPEPGLYRATVEVLEIDIPGAPPQAREMFGQSMAAGRDAEYCLTAADVEKGFRESLRRSQQGDCDFDRFDVSGAKFEAEMTCAHEGGTVAMSLSGTGGRTSSDTTMTMTMDLPGMGDGTIRMRSRSERVGACPA